MKKKELLKLYRDTVKEILDNNYGKEVVFYQGDGKWYNRDTCEYMSDAYICVYAMQELMRDKI